MAIWLKTSLVLAFVLLFGSERGAEPKKEILFFDRTSFEKYLVQHCEGGNDCTSGINGKFTGSQSDCAHFVAHALLAGGMKVPGEEAKCDKGLVVRAIDLRKWFDGAATKYANVSRVDAWNATRALDVGFIEFFYVRRWDAGFDAVHALVLAEASKEKSGLFYAHTNDRCGKEEVSYGKEVGGVMVNRPVVFFRVDKSPLDGGKWAIDGSLANSRFVLEFNGRNATLLERGIESAAGSSKTHTLKLEDAGAGTYVIRRPNDDEALKLLAFTEPTLRQAILSRSPEPSTLTIRLGENSSLSIEWRGLRVKKKADKTLDSITQPSQATPNTFVFKRVS